MDEDKSLTEEEVRVAYRNFMGMIRRLASPMTDDEFARLVRLMTQPDGSVLPDLASMIDAALDERDRARDAANRLRRLSGESYTLQILEGTA